MRSKIYLVFAMVVLCVSWLPFAFSCSKEDQTLWSGRIDNVSSEDLGTTQIGNGVFIKKIRVGVDKLFFLVDENGKLISSGVSIEQRTGKSNNTQMLLSK